MHDRHSQSPSPLGAFIAGAATALLLGGYYLYGPNGKRHQKDTERLILRAKADILDGMRASQDMTEEQYKKLVDTVVSSYESVMEGGAEKASVVADSFKDKWESMREAAKKASDEAKKELKKEDAS
ncbi:MAG: hypothetical protein AAB883_00555 [Patescibacteria group bacterium]